MMVLVIMMAAALDPEASKCFPLHLLINNNSNTNNTTSSSLNSNSTPRVHHLVKTTAHSEIYTRIDIEEITITRMMKMVKKTTTVSSNRSNTFCTNSNFK